jgi:hypothetical protein
MASQLDARLRTRKRVVWPPVAEPSTWRVGDVVEVRSVDEILATLDENAELDNLPFMPEMVRFCGRRMTVAKVAHKTCDTVSRSGMHRMNDAVHLTDARCDGSGHGGCQASCLLFWKTAWLRKVDTPDPGPRSDQVSPVPVLLTKTTRRPPVEGEERYRCQATEMPRAAGESIPLRDARQYVQDVRSGNVSVWFVLRALLVAVYNHLVDRIRPRLPARLRRLGPRQWNAADGRPGPTPTVRLDLQPGEVVRIRSRAEVGETLNEQRLNRGLGFDAEMARFCNRTARVAGKVDRIIDEQTGRMLTMKEPCVLLDGIICEGAYHASCPRSITPYWREIWLERVGLPGPAPT